MESEEVENVEGETIEEIQEQEGEVLDVPVSHSQIQGDENFDDSGNVLQLQVKGKYYKQTYRSAWEQMPDFKGWLRGVQGEPTRAYCTYCQKTLHAHRLSLLKHTCTIRHQKAAQLHNSRKNKMMNQDSVTTVIINNLGQEEGETEEEETIITYTDHNPAELEEAEGMHELDNENEDYEDEEEEDQMQFSVQPVQFQKQFRKFGGTPVMKQEVRQQAKPPISTHVIDSTRGAPVAGLQVSLYKLIDGRWTYINEGITSTDGRFSQFLDAGDFTPGRYKLHYDVDRYFESRKLDTLYPFIEIIMDCKGGNECYHVPVLISPYGYSTYRGS